jgi:hypothetical protein
MGWTLSWRRVAFFVSNSPDSFLRNEELHNLHFLSNIIRMIKEDEMGGAWDEECIYKFSQKSQGKNFVGDLGKDGTVITY